MEFLLILPKASNQTILVKGCWLAQEMRKFFKILFLTIVFCSCQHSKQNKEENTNDLLEKLAAGNSKFADGHSIHPHETIQRIRELKKGQNPFVVIVSCSDSRIPPELIFDQGIGDIFSIRTAGNIIGDYELGSIEYAVEHLHCKLIIVLGHENCGVIQAYASSGKETPGHDHIQTLVNFIAAEEEEKEIPDSLRSDMDNLVRANIAHAVNQLKISTPILKPLAEKNDITIIGAYYDLDNGKVIFKQ